MNATFLTGELEALKVACPHAVEFRFSEALAPLPGFALELGVGAIFPNGAKMAVHTDRVITADDRVRFIAMAGNKLNQWWSETGRHLKPEENTDAR